MICHTISYKNQIFPLVLAITEYEKPYFLAIKTIQDSSFSVTRVTQAAVNFFAICVKMKLDGT